MIECKQILLVWIIVSKINQNEKFTFIDLIQFNSFSFFQEIFVLAPAVCLFSACTILNSICWLDSLFSWALSPSHLVCSGGFPSKLRLGSICQTWAQSGCQQGVRRVQIHCTTMWYFYSIILSAGVSVFLFWINWNMLGYILAFAQLSIRGCCKRWAMGGKPNVVLREEVRGQGLHLLQGKVPGDGTKRD